MHKFFAGYVYSFLILLIVQTGSSQSLTVNPNPFSSRTLIAYELVSADTVTIIISDVSGKNILSVESTQAENAGPHRDSLLMDAFADGVYYLRFVSNHNGNKVQKIIKSRGTFINEQTKSNEVLYFPNPGSEKIYFNLTETPVLITDLTGRIVLHAMIGSDGSLDLSGLSMGLYNLDVQGGVNKIGRLIIEK